MPENMRSAHNNPKMALRALFSERILLDRYRFSMQFLFLAFSGVVTQTFLLGWSLVVDVTGGLAGQAV
jgi:hypothetical protein